MSHPYRQKSVGKQIYRDCCKALDLSSDHAHARRSYVAHDLGSHGVEAGVMEAVHRSASRDRANVYDHSRKGQSKKSKGNLRYFK